MLIWLDAQLPPRFADWLKISFGVEASAVRDLGLRDATDKDIFVAARQSGALLISKDADFVELVQRLGPPPQLVWLTCGNVSNERLEQTFASAFDRVRGLIEAGEPVVELADELSRD